VVSFMLITASPSVGSSPSAILQHLHRNSAVTIVIGYLTAIAALLLLPFLASLKTFAAGTGADVEWRWAITMLAGAVAIAAMLVGSGLLAGAAAVAHRTGSESAVTALFAGAKVCLSFALLPLGAVVLANASMVASTNRSALRWLVRFGAQIGIVAIASGALVFVDSNWLGPGESVIALVGLLIAMWLIAVAFAIVRTDGVAPSNRPDG
jgi:hypothetical protein